MECPECGEVPDAQVCGIEDPYVYDGVLYWVHMPCNTAWPRFTDGPRADLSAHRAEMHDQPKEIR